MLVAVHEQEADDLAAGFTPGERAYIRSELDMFFSTLPRVADGFMLKTWRGGPEAGKPKLSPVAKGLLDCGLMRLDASQRLPRLFFTEPGLAELRRMIADRRLANPKTFAHVRQELGIDPMLEDSRHPSLGRTAQTEGDARTSTIRPALQLGAHHSDRQGHKLGSGCVRHTKTIPLTITPRSIAYSLDRALNIKHDH